MLLYESVPLHSVSHIEYETGIGRTCALFNSILHKTLTFSTEHLWDKLEH